MNSKPISKIAIGTLALAAALAIAPRPVPAHATAQDNPDDALQMITGCLQAGTTPDTFSLIDENGKLWDLQTKSVHFALHVGQKVTLSGTIPEKPKNPAAKPDTSPQNKLNVTELKKLSDSCE
jgi:hypothetical protein